MQAKTRPVFILLPLLLTLLITACQAKQVEVTRLVTEQETVVQTVVETVVQKETVVEIVTSTPETEPEEERTLVICLGQEPDTLYSFFPFGSIAEYEVLAAIYDGPFDTRSFGYQPVILEKIPSLAGGDAVVEAVTVAAGDPVVNADGEPVLLEEGVVVYPADCYESDCAVSFDGTPIQMEQMVVTFKLKPGITWSDGKPLTAHDSVYSFELISDPDIPTGKNITNSTADYVATDDYTTVWTGLPGLRAARYIEFFFSPRPEHAWGHMTARELLEAEESSRKPLGWGPYVIDEWVKGDHITLKKNERYWRAGEGLPKLDKLTYRFTGGEPGAGLAALLSGECDIVDRTHGLQDFELLLELQAKAQINASFVAGRMWERADFDIQPAEDYDRPDIFGDVGTRRGIAHCMDRQAVVDTVLSGRSFVMDTFLPPGHPLYNPDVPHYAFDVARGSALLEEVGWTDEDGDPSTPRVARNVPGVANGTPLEFNYWTTNSYDQQQAAQVVQSSLARCGVKLNLEYWDHDQLFAEGPEAPLWGRRFDMAQSTWLVNAFASCGDYSTSTIPGDPEATDDDGLPIYRLGWSGNNITGFSDANYDAACSAAVAAMPETIEQREAFSEAQRIFSEQLPSIPLYGSVSVVVTHPGLQGYVQDPTDVWEFSQIEEFDISD